MSSRRRRKKNREWSNATRNVAICFGSLTHLFAYGILAQWKIDSPGARRMFAIEAALVSPLRSIIDMRSG